MDDASAANRSQQEVDDVGNQPDPPSQVTTLQMQVANLTDIIGNMAAL